MIRPKMIQKAIVSLSVVSLISALTGCAGSTPHPIPQIQPGDSTKSCSELRFEIQNNQTKIMDLIPRENKTGKNVALGVAGAFFIVPWFFMDFSDSERVEVQGYQLRNNYLMSLAHRKHCKDMPAVLQFAQ